MGSKLEKVYWLLKIWITQLKIHPPPLISLLSWHNHRYFNLNILSSSVGWVIPDGVTGLSFSWLFTWLLDVMTWTLHQFTGSFELYCPSNLLSWLSDDKKVTEIVIINLCVLTSGIQLGLLTPGYPDLCSPSVFSGCNIYFMSNSSPWLLDVSRKICCLIYKLVILTYKF